MAQRFNINNMGVLEAAPYGFWSKYSDFEQEGKLHRAVARKLELAQEELADQREYIDKLERDRAGALHAIQHLIDLNLDKGMEINNLKTDIKESSNEVALDADKEAIREFLSLSSVPDENTDQEDPQTFRHRMRGPVPRYPR